MSKIETFEDLSIVPLDKLYKLRDVATDNCVEIHREYLNATGRLTDIKMEISNRHTEQQQSLMVKKVQENN